MKRLMSFLALAAAASPAYAAPALRQPTKPWVLDYGATACTAIRNYGTDEAPVSLAFRPSPNGTVVRLIFARPGHVPEASHFEVVTNISSTKMKTTGLRFSPKARKLDVTWINFARSDLDALGQAGEIALSSAPVDVRFALPGIRTVLKALDECNADLRTYWHVDDPTLTRKAESVKSLASYFSDRDYPTQAVDEHASGSTKVMLMISESGSLEDCLVEETSGTASLDAMTCAVLLDRAKFTPALDAAGKAVRSVLTQRIVWRMA